MELVNDNPKVVIITDRKELDDQITKTFTHTKLYPAKATSGKHLIELIDDDKVDVITTIINKFNTAERLEAKNESRNIFVLVDERSHRSNYGVICAILDGEIDINALKHQVVFITVKITKIIEKHNQVDWSRNPTIHKRIAQDIDDLFYEMEDEHNVKVSFDMIDKIIENVKTVALRRFG